VTSLVEKVLAKWLLANGDLKKARRGGKSFAV
jgi:hypothetical protein